MSRNRDIEDPRERSPEPDHHPDLRSEIASAARQSPSVSAFLKRLEDRGITPVPSLQSNGRWNGMSYRYQGQTVRGSDLGREYTAKGLRERLGVDYRPERDDPALHIYRDRNAPQRTPEAPERLLERRARERRLRNQPHGLSRDSRNALHQVAAFRVVSIHDLARYEYGGNYRAMHEDFRRLREVGLIETETYFDKNLKRHDLVYATRKGRNLMHKLEPRQRFYSGFVKAQELKHDLGIYRMYRAERRAIEAQGGTIHIITLDFELKRRVFGPLNKHQNEPRPEYEKRKTELAHENGLKVIDGSIVFPDLRITYESRDGHVKQTDLELVSGEYKPEQMQAKHAAGLKIYAPDSYLHGAPYDPDIMGDLLSL